ncbi:MAG: tetratricopeptide repeat protein [Candidatus Peribacteraceae bacterium]|nr:tetratricopeptide repeat protein [Candidatus Peribacteraceae bacterium]
MLSTVRWKQVLPIIALFTIIGAIVFNPIFSSQFVAWDDTQLIVTNPIVHGLSIRHIIQAFSTFDPELYLPLTFLSYQIDYTIGGLNPTIFHIHNFLLHVLNTLLIVWLLFVIAKKRWIAILCGLIFLVHPLHTEVVAWASARKDVQSTFFFLASVMAYIGYQRLNNYDRLGEVTADVTAEVRAEVREPQLLLRIFQSSNILYWFSIALFLCGLLSKVTIATLPIALILFDLQQGRKIDKRVFIEKIPYFALSVIFGVIGLMGKQAVTLQTSLLQKIVLAGKTTSFLLLKFFVPLQLSPMYPQSSVINLSVTFFLLLIVPIGLIICGLLFIKKWPTMSLGFLFFLLTLAPAFTNIVRAGEIEFAADRYAYLPSIGLLIVIATLMTRIDVHRTIRFAAIGITTGVLVIFSWLTHTQATVWHGSDTLFAHTLKLYPKAVPALVNLGSIARDQNQLDQSLTHLHAALELHDTSQARLQIALTLFKQNKLQEATTQAEAALVLDPKNAQAHELLGSIALSNQQFNHAITQYQKALAINPTLINALGNLAGLYLLGEQHAQAENLLRKALKIQPTNIGNQLNLAMALTQQGKTTDAIELYQTILADHPDSALASQKLAELSGN